ncbi:MAG TPA: amidohydrolase family protein [Candidatus Binatia bacterium]
MAGGYRIIDGDGHLLDGPELVYRRYLPEKFRSRTGPFFLQFGWDIRLNGSLGKLDADPDTYRRDIDAEGIELMVAYPSPALSIGLVREFDLAAALARAYNDWARDFGRAVDGRIKAAAVIAPQAVPEAVAEIRRAVTELGAVAVMMPTYVSPGFDLGQPQFDPIYAEAEALGVPVAFHATAQVSQGAQRFHKYIGVHMVSHPFEQMISIISVISNGVLDRFPRLKVAFLEAGVGWVPYWMDRFDEKYHKRRAEMAPLKMPPSEYIRANRCFFTCEGEESALAFTIERFGDDCILYASDYPHWDTDWPNTSRMIVERSDISEKSKEKILGLNALSFYGLK